MDKQKLQEIIESHRKWLNGDGGQRADLKGAYLEGAYLRGAYLRGAYLRGADLKCAYLKGADLEGAYLEGAYLRGAYLRGADLKCAYLRGADLKCAYLRGSDLEGADLEDADLRGSDLRGADLRGSDLKGAFLRGAYLRGADLKCAYLRGADLKCAYLEGADDNLIPFISGIHQAVFSAATRSPGSLDMSDWHTCDTTHCRAGWVVTLAGELGKALEKKVGTPVAAHLIYRKSDKYDLLRGVNFYATNEQALKEMKELSDSESAKAKVQA